MMTSSFAGVFSLTSVSQIYDEYQSVNNEATLRFLVIINPKSGSGSSLKDFRESVEPRWRKKGIEFDVLITRYAGHCSDYISKLPSLSSFYGVVGVGGDGIISEILDGLVSHPSKHAYKKIAIGHIPCGSGNGLAMSLLYEAGKKYNVQEAADMIATGKSRHLDLMEVTEKREKKFGFLAISMGLIADLDILSEPWRCLGGNRFIIGALLALWNKRTYSASLSYLPENLICDRMPSLSEPLPRQFMEVKGNFTLIMACNTSHCSYNAHTAPGQKLDNGYFLITFVLDISRWIMLKILLGFESGSYINNPFVRTIKTQAFRLVPENSHYILTLDGERRPCIPIQARIEKAALRVLCV